ncbi:hypothetical protein LLH06_06130 [Mucilaginibacter daejeonensis]|uniref:DUF6712 family protein n=1 Tax=Mucilaginibacter daejeonensis TaxID=398049 RepID=UPI001D17237D|nr:hypothetical protein [Mucilaginibacter daejeonensis]UEG54537.1 hypothetical protein LLH06_06130 [Mucilaginibacter daejeonensis]
MSENITSTPPASTSLMLTPSLLQQFEDISINVKPERLQVYIKKAQELDLKPFLGYPLYYQLIKYFDTDGAMTADAPQVYKKLFNGCEYTDSYGYSLVYEGLIPTLAYFTFARFIEGNGVHYTATGPVIKQYDNAQAVNTQDVIRLVQQQRSIANAHANEVEKFLQEKQVDYPLWRYNERNKSARQSGPRIRAVDRTEFNGPTGIAEIDNYLPFDNLY